MHLGHQRPEAAGEFGLFVEYAQSFVAHACIRACMHGWLVGWLRMCVRACMRACMHAHADSVLACPPPTTKNKQTNTPGGVEVDAKQQTASNVEFTIWTICSIKISRPTRKWDMRRIAHAHAPECGAQSAVSCSCMLHGACDLETTKAASCECTTPAPFTIHMHTPMAIFWVAYC